MRVTNEVPGNYIVETSTVLDLIFQILCFQVITIFVLLYALPETKGQNAEDLYQKYETRALIREKTLE